METTTSKWETLAGELLESIPDLLGVLTFEKTVEILSFGSFFLCDQFSTS